MNGEKFVSCVDFIAHNVKYISSTFITCARTTCIILILFYLLSAASSSSNTALYVGLLVAFLLFTLVAGLVYRYFRKKDRDHSLYNMARSGTHLK